MPEKATAEKSEDKKRVNFYIPREQYGGLARLAGAETAERGERVTMTDLIVRAIGEFLERNAGK